MEQKEAYIEYKNTVLMELINRTPVFDKQMESKCSGDSS
jgi:hypothetical protein